MDTKHTPGPWDVCPYPNTDFAYGIWKVGVRLALIDRRPQMAASEEYANARLIAAAPALLAALQAAETWLRGAAEKGCDAGDLLMIDAANQARAALAAAEGQEA